jgi:hypothetical protein
VAEYGSGRAHSLFVICSACALKTASFYFGPLLYPGSSPVEADLRFRQGRLKLEIPGAGPFRYALVNGRNVPIDANGAIRLGREFEGGRISFHA